MSFEENACLATIRRTQVFMQSVWYFWPFISKFALPLQIFAEEPNIKFHGKPSSGRSVGTWGQTGGLTKHSLLGAFHDYAKSPKIVDW